MNRLLMIAPLLISFNASTTTLAFPTPANAIYRQCSKSAAIAHKLHNIQPIFSTKDDDADNLLEKARKLRQDVSAIETTKREAQKEKDTIEQAEQKERYSERMRYSAEVPILKDMGDEVMERVDFPPRIKGGEF